MQAVVDFLLEYYIWVLAVLVILLITVIGFLADTKKKKKLREKTMQEDINNNMNTGVNNFNDINQGMNVGFNNQNDYFDSNMSQNNNNLFEPNLNGGLNNNMLSQNMGISEMQVNNDVGVFNSVIPEPSTAPVDNGANQMASGFNNDSFFVPASEQKPVIEPRQVVMPTPVVEPTPVVNPIPVVAPTSVQEPTVTMQSFVSDLGVNVTAPIQPSVADSNISTTSPVGVTMNNGPVVNPIPVVPGTAPSPSVSVPEPSINVVPEPIPNVAVGPVPEVSPNSNTSAQNSNYGFVQGDSSIVMGMPQNNINGQISNNGQ